MRKIALILTLLLVSSSSFAQSVMVTAILSGRNVKSDKLLIPDYDFSENGQVVVNIEVNREGKVINAMPGADGTTLKSALLWANCRKAAQEAQFEEKRSADETQYGTIIYAFLSKSDFPVDESPRSKSPNPLAGADLSDSFSVIDEPIEYQGAKKFKVFQVLAKHFALVESEDTKYRTIELYGDPIVLMISDKANVYYDDLIISVGTRQKTMQLGTYRYKTRMGTKTVPIVMIVDK